MPVKRKWIKKVFRISLKIAVWLIGLSLFFVILFKWVPVPVTPLMVIRTIQQMGSGKGITLKHHWVSRGKISPDLQLAVVCSEDQNFLLHHGFDLKAIEKAMEALGNAELNGRDFYPQGPDAYYQARKERDEAFEKLRAAQQYVGEMLMGICDQKR